MTADKLTLLPTADGSYTLGRGESHETYHSRFGAVTEAREVFLRNSGVLERLQRQAPTCVLEIGFGTGLNFLLTAHAARNYRCNLVYTSYEIELPPVSLISTLLSQNTPECDAEIKLLLEAVASQQQHLSVEVNPFSSLQLWTEDAVAAKFPHQQYDTVYLDAFSRNESPEFWETPFLQKVYYALKTGGSLATYSVNRKFRDALEAAGFHWDKLPGPSGKREVIVATKPQT